MSSLFQEIATRARRLIKRRGGAATPNAGRFLRVGGYCIRIAHDNELFITGDESFVTVYRQVKPSWEGKGPSLEACRKLRDVLRKNMLLEDLADV